MAGAKAAFWEWQGKGFDGSARNQTKGIVCAVDVNDDMEQYKTIGQVTSDRQPQ